jgi:hypothetical protein
LKFKYDNLAMFNQIDLKCVPKSAKEMERTSHFYDFLSEELHHKKRAPPQNYYF